ncbi:MAG: TetR/AcrR family transcriptional regulator [Flavobacteriaceae bacterium]|nr:TetR/AcrR family transcriptional regulator [Flavobacteriaceae bacterium]
MKTAEKLKLAAHQIISKEGVDALSMRKLAEAIGIKGPSIYKHFSSKDELLNSLKSEGLDRLYHLMSKAVKKTDPPIQNLISLSMAYQEFAKKHPEEFKLIFLETTSLRGDLEEEFTGNNPYGLLLVEMKKYAEQNKLLQSSTELEAATYGYWSLTHGMVCLKQTHLKDFKADFMLADQLALNAYLQGVVK